MTIVRVAPPDGWHTTRWCYIDYVFDVALPVYLSPDARRLRAVDPAGVVLLDVDAEAVRALPIALSRDYSSRLFLRWRPLVE